MQDDLLNNNLNFKNANFILSFLHRNEWNAEIYPPHTPQVGNQWFTQYTACAHEWTWRKKVQQCKSASDPILLFRYQTNEKLAAHWRRYDTALPCKADAE